MTVHETLVRARNLIDREGWVQGTYGFFGGGYCVRGACHAAGRRDEKYGPLNGEGLLAIAELDRVFPVPGGLVAWNDAEERTKGEVLALFDRAIAATAPPPPDLFFTDILEETEVV